MSEAELLARKIMLKELEIWLTEQYIEIDKALAEFKNNE